MPPSGGFKTTLMKTPLEIFFETTSKLYLDGVIDLSTSWQINEAATNLSSKSFSEGLYKGSEITSK